MTQPRNPAEAITTAAQRIQATKDAGKALSAEIAEQRRKDAEAASQQAPEATP